MEHKKSNPIVSGKIKREIMKSTFEKGGLNAPDINNINKSIKYKNFRKHISNDSHMLHIIYSNHKANLSLSHTNYLAGTITQTYVGTAIETHRQIGNLLHRDIKLMSNEEDGIHKNYFAYIQNTEICNSPFTNVNQQAMLARLLTYNIRTFNDVYKEKVNSRFPQLFLDIHQIFNTYPIEWRRLITKTNRSHNILDNEIPIGLNKWQRIDNLNIKQINKYLITNTEIENVKEYLIKRQRINQNERHLTLNSKNPFIELNKTTSDMKIRNIQFKILHNIYPTMKHLYIWKIKETPNCTHCGIEETLKHAIFECPIASNCWLKFKNICGNLIGDLEYQDILFGTSTNNQLHSQITRTERYAIDTLLIIIKQRLILQREDKRDILDSELNNLLKNWIRIEKYVAIKNNMLNKYNNKWQWIENIVIPNYT